MLQHIHIYIHVTLGQWTVQWYTSSDNQILSHPVQNDCKIPNYAETI